LQDSVGEVLGRFAAANGSGLLPGGALVPLLAFNLGVEAGKIAVVLVAVPLLRLLTRGALRLGV